jgi:hypothetical protein
LSYGRSHPGPHRLRNAPAGSTRVSEIHPSSALANSHGRPNGGPDPVRNAPAGRAAWRHPHQVPIRAAQHGHGTPSGSTPCRPPARRGPVADPRADRDTHAATRRSTCPGLRSLLDANSPAGCSRGNRVRQDLAVGANWVAGGSGRFGVHAQLSGQSFTPACRGDREGLCMRGGPSRAIGRGPTDALSARCEVTQSPQPRRLTGNYNKPRRSLREELFWV